MKNQLAFLFFIAILLTTKYMQSQTKETGPIIMNYGAVYKVENTDYKINTNKDLKAVFDIMNSPEDNEKRNASIETAARFLNMHAQEHIPANKLHAILVVHSKASKDIITNKAYKKRYGKDNPNEDMIKTLLKAGVQVILCGQSAGSRNIAKEDLIPGVQLSLSAMTALIQLQNEGYSLIKF
ncbi:MAG: hypothetical protein COA50_10910 [Flavobacteriaceae bacterium]|nr:MAG: hypothetical protein COA50_10910 [Flavobacteriaceae bacterium]